MALSASLVAYPPAACISVPVAIHEGRNHPHQTRAFSRDGTATLKCLLAELVLKDEPLIELVSRGFSLFDEVQEVADLVAHEGDCLRQVVVREAIVEAVSEVLRCESREGVAHQDCCPFWWNEGFALTHWLAHVAPFQHCQFYSQP